MLQLLYCLTGDEHAPPMLDGLLDGFVIKIKSLIEDVIWEGKLRGVTEADRFYDAYNMLAPAEQASFCLSPPAFQALTGAVDFGTGDYLEKLTALCIEIRGAPTKILEITQDLIDSGGGGDQMLLGGLSGSTSIAHIAATKIRLVQYFSTNMRRILRLRSLKLLPNCMPRSPALRLPHRRLLA